MAIYYTWFWILPGVVTVGCTLDW